jgi:hypothetical protein
MTTPITRRLGSTERQALASKPSQTIQETSLYRLSDGRGAFYSEMSVLRGASGANHLNRHAVHDVGSGRDCSPSRGE